jgi:hypothetical protein
MSLSERTSKFYGASATRRRARMAKENPDGKYAAKRNGLVEFDNLLDGLVHVQLPETPTPKGSVGERMMGQVATKISGMVEFDNLLDGLMHVEHYKHSKGRCVELIKEQAAFDELLEGLMPACDATRDANEVWFDNVLVALSVTSDDQKSHA